MAYFIIIILFIVIGLPWLIEITTPDDTDE